MEVISTDVAIIGAGGAGLRSAIAVAETDPGLKVALISKVYPMRSHTVAAEGGSAGVVQDHDSLDNHFNDTVSGGDWLCDQEVVDYFVGECTQAMTQLEHWGCPWSRKPDGHVNVRAFGGMKIERTWFAADKTGFHMLHTLFQTSIKYPSINRFDEYFALDLIVDDGRVQGVVAMEIRTGAVKLFLAKSVIIATGGAGRVYQVNTNGAIVTGDGMSLAYRHGAPLRDMEFVQYHPTALPRIGVLITEGCRGEGGLLVNKDGYRYLQDYGLGPPDPWPRKKAMELGPRDRLSQAYWHEEQKGRTVTTPFGQAVLLDLRHLGEKKLRERLPLICELAESYVGVDPVHEPIPVRPAVHYTMGGIRTDINTATDLAGLYAVGECSSCGIHGANRLGSNSLAELVVFGKQAGNYAAEYARGAASVDEGMARKQAGDALRRVKAIAERQGGERLADIRNGMADTMEEGCGIYRTGEGMQATCDKLAELKERYQNVAVDDKTRVFNTELLYAVELGYMLEVAEAMAHSGVNRRESRGSHQRIDGYEKRDDQDFLKHSLAYYNPGGPPRIDYQAVNITRSPPADRVYGGKEDDSVKEAANV